MAEPTETLASASQRDTLKQRVDALEKASVDAAKVQADFDAYKKQVETEKANAPDTSAATAGTATGYKVSGTAGDTKVSLSSVTAATATVKTGDAFIVDGYLYRFTADATAASGAASDVTIDQPLHATLTNKDVVVVNKPNSVAFHRNGLAMVTRNLALPMGASNASIASADGLGVRVVYGYDMTTKTDTVSFDILYGIAKLDDRMIVKLV